MVNLMTSVCSTDVITEELAGIKVMDYLAGLCIS